MIITIDGPSASGKSTVARILARKLRFYYLYSGLLFRALAYILIKYYGYTHDTMSYPDATIIKKILDPNFFVYRYEKGVEHIFYKGNDITLYLKNSEIDQAASLLSTHVLVRDELLQLQRMIANNYDVIIDGRDAGSLVFPYADKKFYLTASLQERARRWQQAAEKRGIVSSLEDAQHELYVRDTRDSTRQIAPLIVPEGAIVIDNSDLTLQETFHKILEHIEI